MKSAVKYTSVYNGASIVHENEQIIVRETAFKSKFGQSFMLPWICYLVRVLDERIPHLHGLANIWPESCGRLLTTTAFLVRMVWWLTICILLAWLWFSNRNVFKPSGMWTWVSCCQCRLLIRFVSVVVMPYCAQVDAITSFCRCTVTVTKLTTIIAGQLF